MAVKSDNRFFWTDAQIAVLVEFYPHSRAQTIADTIGKTCRAVYAMANKLGLRKSEAFMHSHWSGRLGPGNKPWIAGKKMGAEWSARGRMSTTQFRPGQVAHNWAPVGHVREVYGGYLQVKLLAKGRHTETYRFVHHLVWELHHGAIPDGHLVRFRDGNRHNTDPANLELWDLRTNGTHNMHALPPDLQELVRLKGRITKAIRAQEKQREQ